MVLGWEEALPREVLSHPAVRLEPVGSWTPDRERTSDQAAGELCGLAIERGVELALAGEIDGLVTGPISKKALAAAGYPFPGHTEFLHDRAGASDVCMMMTAESTPLGGPLRMALLTSHIPLREVPSALSQELVVRRTRIAEAALREWWGLASPTLAFAGVNPHARLGRRPIRRRGAASPRSGRPAAPAGGDSGAGDLSKRHGIRQMYIG